MPADQVPQPDAPVLKEIVRRLVAAYRPHGIYLFGSAARGDAHPASDYDILLVVPDDTPEEQRRSSYALQVLQGVGVSKDVVIYRRSSFDGLAHLKSSLPGTVLREGKVLYAG